MFFIVYEIQILLFFRYLMFELCINIQVVPVIKKEEDSQGMKLNRDTILDRVKTLNEVICGK